MNSRGKEAGKCAAWGANQNTQNTLDNRGLRRSVPATLFTSMKTCAYCGRDNDLAAIFCAECGTDEFKPLASARSPSETISAPLKFVSLPEAGREHDWVTLLRCATLAEADMIASHLEGAGIPAFIPDQFLMQAVSFNLTYGFVRVQVAPRDYERAKEIVTTPSTPLPPPLPSA